MSTYTKRIPALHQFIQQLGLIPFISSKHSYRLADYFLTMDEQKMEAFFTILIELRKTMELCVCCNGWKEKGSIDCFWCGPKRNRLLICVVESWIDAASIDRAGSYGGTFHVLGGAISPLDGIMPDQLAFKSLLHRIEQSEEPLEILIATNQTPEGEATAVHLHNLINRGYKHVQVSQLLPGIPVGSSLEYVDKLTLSKAILYRRHL